jgi:hypothetical protein
LGSDLFVRIIRGELSGVDDRVTHDVGDYTDPKSSDTISSKNLLVAVKRSIVTSIGCGHRSLSLESDLYDISGVGNGDTNSTRSHTSSDFGQERGVLTFLKGTSEHISNGRVETDTESSIDHLTLESGSQSTPESKRTFFGYNSLGGSREAIVTGSCTRLSDLSLETDFSSIKGNSAEFSPRSS